MNGTTVLQQNESFKRLQSLLTVEFVSTIPRNVEAQRRLQFFTNSLFMKMPVTPTVRAMKSFRYLVFTYLKIVTSISFVILILISVIISDFGWGFQYFNTILQRECII